MIDIRKADADDVAAVAALWHRGWHQGHAEVVPRALVESRVPEEFLPRVEAHLAGTYVATRDEKLAGFYMLEGDELYQFYVDAAFQGQGVASVLAASAEAALAGRVAWLACSVGNDRAAGFYEKVGWVRRATQEYQVETASAPQQVTVWRYEKDLT